MAVVPRRRSLIGRAAAPAGATGAGGSSQEPSSPPTAPPEGIQTALHAARPGAKPREARPEIPPEAVGSTQGAITASGLEVFERGRPGRGFDASANDDSFAMDDPPSEEVRVDPRFARAFEPATELMDRRQLAAFGAPDTLTEDELDAVLPPPRFGAARSVTPSPVSRGWVPPSTVARSPAEDPATERIPRDHVPPELLVEQTVPTGLAYPSSDTDDSPSQGPDYTQPIDTGTQPSFDPLAPETARVEVPPELGVQELRVVPIPEVSPEAPTVPSAATRTGAVDEEPPPNGWMFGLVALVGSGGVIAGVGVGALVFGLLFLVLYAGRGSSEDPGPLPPIELGHEAPSTPTDAVETPTDEAPTAPPADAVEEAPAPEPGPPPKRRTPRPQPVVAPVPAPVPVPVPVVEEVPDLEPVPEPEPEKRGPFGRGKKGR